MNRLEQLTGWRFIAAFAVVICHVIGTIYPQGSNLAHKAFLNLGNFVDFFFILSGFILSHTYRDKFINGQLNKVSFMIARLARVYPGVIFSLLVALPGYIILNRPLMHTVDGGIGLLTYSLATIFLVKSWLPMVNWDGMATTWNAPLWSIETELFFYLSFPFLCKIFARLRPNNRLLIAPVSLIVLVIVAAYYDLIIVHGDPRFSSRVLPWVLSSPYVRIFSFILGMGLYEYHIAYAEKLKTMAAQFPMVGWIGLICIYVIGNIFLGPMSTLYGLQSFVFSIWILFSANSCAPTKFLGSKLFVYGGELSFSIYLLHLPMMRMFIGAAEVIQKFSGPIAPLRTVSILLSVVASLLLAAWMYKFVEVPWRSKIRSFADKLTPVK